MNKPRVLHCWAAPTDKDGFELDGTCLLLNDHKGPHEYTPDKDIVVKFTPKARSATLQQLKDMLSEVKYKG